MYNKTKAENVINLENSISKSNDNESNNNNDEEMKNNDINNSKENNNANSENEKSNNIKKEEEEDDNYSEHDYSFFNLRELLEKGEIAYNQQKYKKATDIYKTLINKFPEEVKGYIMMGKI